MKTRFKKCFKSISAFLCAVLLGTAMPLQMAFAANNAIPEEWWGSYETSANSRYLLIISSKGTNISFRGYIFGVGHVAATKPTSIYFNPTNNSDTGNFEVVFSSYSIYDSSTQKYIPGYGCIVFTAKCCTQNTDIKVLTGDGGFNDPKSFDVYRQM